MPCCSSPVALQQPVQTSAQPSRSSNPEDGGTTWIFADLNCPDQAQLRASTAFLHRTTPALLTAAAFRRTISQPPRLLARVVDRVQVGSCLSRLLLSPRT
ncbi:hypothetical protein XPA_007008 [Xanthoria parietina]